MTEKDVIEAVQVLKAWCLERREYDDTDGLQCECPFLFIHPDGATRCSLENDCPCNY